MVCIKNNGLMKLFDFWSFGMQGGKLSTCLGEGSGSKKCTCAYDPQYCQQGKSIWELIKSPVWIGTV